MPSARSLPCTRCGGRFAIQTIAGEVHCPCGGETCVSSVETVRELEAYREEVDQKLGRADEELKYVDAWQRTEQSISWSGMAMPILITKDTTFIIQGITGREAVNLTRENLAYGAKIIGGVTPTVCGYITALAFVRGTPPKVALAGVTKR